MSAQRKSMVMRAVERSGRVYGLDPDAFDPAYLGAQLPIWFTLVGPGRYFDTTMDGLHHVPDEPVMFVSNHSGGTTALDGVGFLIEWYRHHGVERPVHGLVHDLLFASHALGRYFERCGMVRARPDLARDAQARGRSVLVMPGGDRDVWRPARHRYRCDFGGRTGYARTALQLGLPVVPVAHAGAHSTLHVLTDGRDFARFVRLHRAFRAEIWPVHLSLPWGLALGPVPHLPPPAHLDYAIGEPIPPLGPPTPENVERLDAQVRASVQRLLLDLRARRRRRDKGLARNARRAAETARSLRDLVRELRQLEARAEGSRAAK